MEIQSWICKTPLDKEFSEDDAELVISLYDIKQHSTFTLIFAINTVSQKIIRIKYNSLKEYSQSLLIKDLYAEESVGKSIDEIMQLIKIYNVIYI